ncbi:MAG: AraC family ligand binding domain-containing protein, partial [Flavobacteriaceae bacterium]
MKKIHNIKTITEVHDFLGLAKPKHPLVSVVYHHDGWENIDFEGKKYAFALYQVTLKNFKAGSFVYGRNTYDFQEGTMVFTGPNQVMEFSNHTESISTEYPGWTLLFHPDLIRKSPLGSTIDDYSFFDYEVHEALHLSDDEKKSLTE